MQNDVVVRWHNQEQTILYATLPHNWTWGDAYEMIDRVYEQQETVSHPVDIIYDLSDVNPLPKAAIPNLRRLVNSEHPNDRLNVIITRDTFLRQLLEVVVRTFLHDRRNPARLRFTTSLEKAMSIIQGQVASEVTTGH